MSADPTPAASYALFKDGKQISKAHSTKEAVMMEAFQRRAVVSWAKDFWSDVAADAVLAASYEIKVAS